MRIHGLRVQIETEHFVLCGQEESLVPKDAMYNLELMFLELRKYLSKTQHRLIEDERFYIMFVEETLVDDNPVGSRVGHNPSPALQEDMVRTPISWKPYNEEIYFTGNKHLACQPYLDASLVYCQHHICLC